MTANAIRSAAYEIDYPLAVSRGAIKGAVPFGSYGEKTTAGADSGVLWSNGAFVFPPAVGASITLVSTSVQDAPAGAGMRSVELHYLDATLTEQKLIVSLNGTTPVVTGITDCRFIQVFHRVTGGPAAGNISAYNGGNTYSYIAAGALRSSSSVRMVPKGKRWIINGLFGGAVSGTAAARVLLRLASPSFYEHDFTADNVFMPHFSAGFQDTSSGLTLPCPLAFTEGQSAGMTFEIDKAATISGSLFGWLEDL